MDVARIALHPGYTASTSLGTGSEGSGSKLYPGLIPSLAFPCGACYLKSHGTAQCDT